MRIRWRGLELPSRMTPDKETLSDTYGLFTIEPFERGFGTSIGNSLRRVLLSSLEGSAVSSIKIEGVQHEFSTIEGVVEDVTEIVLNAKHLVVRSHSDEPKTLVLEANQAGPVTAGMIQDDPTVEVISKDLVLATLSEDIDFNMEIEIGRGRGYRPAEENRSSEQPVGSIAVDSLFSPVRRVRYRTENTRVGQRTNYDKLIVEIWTNGTVTPELALVEAAKILRKHLNPFVQYFSLGGQVQEEGIAAGGEQGDQSEKAELARKLNMGIDEMYLSVRSTNCLEAQNIATVGELVSKSEPELLKVRNFGKTSLKEIKKKLEDMGLSLGMDVEELMAKTPE